MSVDNVNSVSVVAAKNIVKRIRAINWATVTNDLNAVGYSVIDRLIPKSECNALAAL